MADTMLHFSNDNLCQFMSKDEIREKAPYVFATVPTNPNLTEKYVMASTETIIDDMAKLGWGVVDCKQQRANKRSNIHSFHMVAFQNKNIFITKDVNGEEVVDCFPRIIVTNSHDGFKSFKFMVGFFRLVCSNGLIVATEKFTDISIRHINYTFDELRNTVTNAIKLVSEQVESINEMSNRELSQEEKYKFAEAALRIRQTEEEKKKEIAKEVLDDMLAPVRPEDEGNNLWVVFNLLQEKVIKGDYNMISPTNGKSRKARPITGVAKNIEVNQALFLAANSYRAAA